MSTTTNIGLFKHDNPSTNTEQFNIDKSLNQNWDKTDKAFGEDRQRLDLLEASNTIYNYKGKADTLDTIKSKTATQGDVWYCEADSTYYAYNGSDWIPVNLNLKLEAIDELKEKTIKCLQEVETPTPISGTSIDLYDSAEGKITEIKISGNSKQNKREGKNLLELINGTYENNGITAVVKDGIITLNGTATGTSFVHIPLIAGSQTLLANTQYTLRAFNEKTVGDSANISALRMGDDGTYQAPLYNTNSKYIHGQASDYIFNAICIRTESGLTYNNFVVKPQLELGNGTDTWEQGGVSPNPDYSSEVESCGDNENLFDKDNANVLDNVYIDGNGYLNKSDGAKSLYIECKPNRTYTISKISSSNFRIATTDEKPNLYVQGTLKFAGTTENNKTIITGSTNKYIIVYYYNSGSDTLTEEEIRSSIKIEEGSKVTPYTPYGQGCINEVICNKNVLNKDKLDKTYFSIDSNDNITSLVADNRTFTNIEAIANVIEGKKYTLSCENIVTGSIQIAYTLDNTVIDRQYNTKKISFTAPKTGSIAFKILNVTYPYVLGKIQIEAPEGSHVEEGIEATDYIEHQSQTYTIPTQQPFRSIENIRDTFIKKNNKWYERHYIGEFSLNSNATYTKYSSTSANIYYSNVSNFTSQEPVYPEDNTKIAQIVSTHGLSTYVNDIAYNGAKKVALSRPATKTIWIGFGSSGPTTIAEFKTWLQEQDNAGTPVTIDYVLATPIDIECTEEQSTILFDIEQNAKTYDKVTHIYSTDEVEPNIELTYKKDIETLFANTLVEGV